MRTTLDIDKDVLRVAKEIVSRRATTTGRVLSDLARAALEPMRGSKTRNGVPVLPRRRKGSSRPNLALINRLRDFPQVS